MHATLLSETGRVLTCMLLCCQIRYRSIGPAEIATWERVRKQKPNMNLCVCLKGVGVMRDIELKLEGDEAPHTLRASGEGGT